MPKETLSVYISSEIAEALRRIAEETAIKKSVIVEALLARSLKELGLDVETEVSRRVWQALHRHYNGGGSR